MFINAVCGSGSTGRIVTGLMDALEEQGVETLAAYGRDTAPLEYNTYRIGSDLDVYVHGILSRITDRHGLYSKAATVALIDKIREFKPDILHLHNIHGYYINYKLLFDYIRNEYRGRIVWTLHDCWAFTGHCSHFSYIRCDRWRTGCHNCPQKNEYPRSMLMDSSKFNYRLKKELFTGISKLELVTPSEWLLKVAAQSFLGEYPGQAVPTGIDLNTFKWRRSDIRKKYGVGEKPLILGVANPWRERKGYSDFLRLAREMGADYSFAMIGLRHKDMKGLPQNVIGIGHTDSLQEMVEWYSSADIYVNMTKEDTFPTANLEALACGTPVITYDAGGSPESLNDSCGRVVPCGDIEAVKEAVLELLGLPMAHMGSSGTPEKALAASALADENVAYDLQQKCRERAELYSSKRRFAQYLEKVYRI
ncbi:MAG: glycosyltransferase [Lachnospiraceae bacterium]|nr:glycosyltransferase [Lachnospiraceae bacterium]